MSLRFILVFIEVYFFMLIILNFFIHIVFLVFNVEVFHLVFSVVLIINSSILIISIECLLSASEAPLFFCLFNQQLNQTHLAFRKAFVLADPFIRLSALRLRLVFQYFWQAKDYLSYYLDFFACFSLILLSPVPPYLLLRQ